jgi:hypothetical protein
MPQCGVVTHEAMMPRTANRLVLEKLEIGYESTCIRRTLGHGASATSHATTRTSTSTPTWTNLADADILRYAVLLSCCPAVRPS